MAQRLCSQPGCGTHLSRYNPEDLCGPCQRTETDAALAVGRLPRRRQRTAAVPMPPALPDRPVMGTTVPWSARLMTSGSKGRRGVCSYPRCRTSAAFAQYELRPQPHWRAFCSDHVGPTDVQLAECAAHFDALRAEYESTPRPPWLICSYCGEEIVRGAGHVEDLTPAGPQPLHRVCLLDVRGYELDPAVRAELAELDGLVRRVLAAAS